MGRKNANSVSGLHKGGGQNDIFFPLRGDDKVSFSGGEYRK